MAHGAATLEAALLAKSDQVAKTVAALGDASQEIQRLIAEREAGIGSVKEELKQKVAKAQVEHSRLLEERNLALTAQKKMMTERSTISANQEKLIKELTELRQEKMEVAKLTREFEQKQREAEQTRQVLEQTRLDAQKKIGSIVTDVDRYRDELASYHHAMVRMLQQVHPSAASGVNLQDPALVKMLCCQYVDEMVGQAANTMVKLSSREHDIEVVCNRLDLMRVDRDQLAERLKRVQAAPVSSAAPAPMVEYALAMEKLRHMGFEHEENMLQALRDNGGDVERATTTLLA
jgi:chromosome segregation ATPase